MLGSSTFGDAKFNYFIIVVIRAFHFKDTFSPL